MSDSSKKGFSNEGSNISESTNTNTNDYTDTLIDKSKLEEEFKGIVCDDKNLFNEECNKFLLKRELIEREELSDKEDDNDFLYPDLNDKNFNIKIATKKEFNDTKYDGPDFTKSVEEQADYLANAPYELQPHQAFVKNFMSFQTPYSSLLLFHGLGSGKTCSSIGVTEEMRDYMRRTGINKRIIIVASENVQDNFRLQLFDERKLEEINGVWTMKGCIGNKLLKEINPTNSKMTKDKVISQIKGLINSYYIFMGYIQFANYIIKTMHAEEGAKETFKRKKNDKKKEDNNESKREKTKIETLREVHTELNDKTINRIRKEFNDRLVVIDEVHNIRKTDNSDKNKKVAVNLEYLVKAAQNMRFLFLSATPMYNNYKEIIWLLNIMNMNDKRARVDVKDVFNSKGEFKKGGEELLIRKATGYVSFVRGENPYTFPYRVYPNEFAPDETFPKIPYPSYLMSLKKIKHEDKKRILSLYLTKIGNCNGCGLCQRCCYKYIIQRLRNKINFEDTESFGYTTLLLPLESLIISYPHKDLKELLDETSGEKYSEEFSPSLSEVVEEEEENIQENGNEIHMEENERTLTEGHDITQSNTKNTKTTKKTDNPLDRTLTEGHDITQSNTKNTKNTNKQLDKTLTGGENSSSSSSSNKNYIEPNILTGHTGLNRMMNFKDNIHERGSFEYKETTIKTYGRIFSQKEIGKYSSKIKCILDKIYDPETKRVSDGIILIYSNYIDSGLIPMALALEEMGFTRYGVSGIKPLFKERPSSVVDSRTMKPPTDKNDFKPARYAMITGDHNLSPDNDYEVKGITNDDNKDGYNIKVVLISRSGSEGIDFKFLRQVHILDPWYNMNRPEQIIGRAVRNFSHVLLPFKKRNVEIYLHGTILDDNKEEAADLYVYRLAEYKAIQIGKVARVLKETAVDCIINYEQTKFTQEIMSKHLKDPITQELSTGKVIHNFKVGDVPFSPACDYMATCNYSCRPGADVDEKDLNEDTYDLNFIMINSEKILQKIRSLFKEGFFYKKDMLLKAIRTPKEYPYVQIYAALTQLIEDDNEFIVDRYGRNGKLVNIGEYYLFQPNELKDKNISIYERSVPLDYKHSMVNFEIKPTVIKPPTPKMPTTTAILTEKPVTEKETHKKGKKVFDEMKEGYNVTIEYLDKSSVPTGDGDWYKYSGLVIKKMMKEYPESREHLLSYLVAHMVEVLLYEDKHNLMNYIYSLNVMEENSLEKFIKSYFERNSFITKNKTIFIAYKLDKIKMLILGADNEWTEATPSEVDAIKKSGDTHYDPIESFAKIVGFIGYEKGNKVMSFKTKDMTSSRNKGATCHGATKNTNIQKLNKILGEDKYTHDNTKLIKDKSGKVIQEAMHNPELCVMIEFVLRHFNQIEKVQDGKKKKWFLLPEMAIGYKLYDI